MKLFYGLPLVLLGTSLMIGQHRVAQAQTLADVNAIAKKTTVRVDGANTGSGVIINRIGNTDTEFTNKQVVRLSRNDTIQTFDGRRYNFNQSTVKSSDVNLAASQLLDVQDSLGGINKRLQANLETNITDDFDIPINTDKILASAAVIPTQTIAQPAQPPQPRIQLLQPTSPQIVSDPKKLIDEVWQIIARQYVDWTFNKLDWQAVRREYLSKSYSSNQEAYKSIREMLKKLDDPYTRFMNPEEFKSLRIDTSGQLIGIGITIGQDEKTKKLTVIAPIEDTPAFKAGLLAKDIITKIDGKSTEGMDTNVAVSLIRGQAGTLVNLTIDRNSQQKEFNITRAKIEIHPVKYSEQKTPIGNVGYIRLNQFSANAGKEMRNAITNLESKQVAGYVLDLRNNPGGLVFASIEIAKMWLDKGTIVSIRERVGKGDHEVASGHPLTNKPLVILVDKGSASASEILSGALQDNKRAELVGTRTFGKGLVQSVRSLGDGSGLAVTIAKYYTPLDHDINKLGIEPDVKIELTDAQRQNLWLHERDKIGTLQDPQFAKAVEVLGKKISSR